MTRTELQDTALILLAALELQERSDIYRLMKVEFLHRDQTEHASASPSIPFSGEFYRDNYGPISRDVYKNSTALADAGLLEPKGAGGRQRMTPQGTAVAKTLKAAMDPTVMAEIQTIAATVRKLSFEEIKALCYRKLAMWSGHAKTIGELEVGDPVYPRPQRWRQVIPDEVLLAFAATIEASKQHRAASDRRGLDELERVLG